MSSQTFRRGALCESLRTGKRYRTIPMSVRAPVKLYEHRFSVVWTNNGIDQAPEDRTPAQVLVFPQVPPGITPAVT